MKLFETTGLAGRCRLLLAVSLMFIGASGMLSAQENPFAPGWALNAEASNIRFQSVKNQTKVESSSFATFSGIIDESGRATIKVLLDSVDTKIDLRNVRMRFLFFETFKFPEATITLNLTPDMISDLQTIRRKSLTINYDFNLHGITKQLQSEVVVTLLTDEIVSVASAAPISIGVADFGLTENLNKLIEAAGLQSIVPSSAVTFDFLFARQADSAAAVVALREATPQPTEAPATAALEAEGDFTYEACKGRFEILSRTGNIYFRTSSARLDRESTLLLNSIVDIVMRCPGLTILVAGHTDSDGDEAANQKLSEARAGSVVEFLVGHGVEAGRISPIGRGESRPVAPNDTAANKQRNRRIEFSVIDG